MIQSNTKIFVRKTPLNPQVGINGKQSLSQEVVQALSQINQRLQNMDDKYETIINDQNKKFDEMSKNMKNIKSISLRLNIMSAELQNNSKKQSQNQQQIKKISAQIVGKFDNQQKQYQNKINKAQSMVQGHSKRLQGLLYENQERIKKSQISIALNSGELKLQGNNIKLLSDTIKKHTDELNKQNSQLKSTSVRLENLKSELSQITNKININQKKMEINFHEMNNNYQKNRSSLTELISQAESRINKKSEDFKKEYLKTTDELKNNMKNLENTISKNKTQTETQITKVYLPKFDQISKTISNLFSSTNNLSNTCCRLQNSIDFLPLSLSHYQIQWEQPQNNSIYACGNKILPKKQNSEQKGNQRVDCFLNVGFTRQVTRKQCWAIQIKSNNKQILIGISTKQTQQSVSNSKSQSFYGSLQKRSCWFISSTDNSSDSGYNIKYNQIFNNNSTNNSFKFTKGDVIYVSYDPIFWCLTFMKNLNDGAFRLPISPLNNDQTYYPFAKLYNTDSVQLVLPGKPLS